MAAPPYFTPAVEPPAGVIPNPNHPESLAVWNTVCAVTCLSVATTVFAARAYVRLHLKKQWILEDWMCLLAWLGLVAYCTLTTMTFHHHGGIHVWDLTAKRFVEASYWFYVASIVYGPTILFAKLGILLFLRRIFVPHKGTLMCMTTRALILIICLFYTALTIVKIFECTPREKIWEKHIPGKCVNVPTLLTTSGMFNTISDFVILVIPIGKVMGLRISKVQKLAILGVITVGLSAPIFSLVGVVVRFQVSASPDQTWFQPIMLLWATAEITSGLICVCVPGLPTICHRNKPDRSGPSYVHTTLAANFSSQSVLSPRKAGKYMSQAQGLVSKEPSKMCHNARDAGYVPCALTKIDEKDIGLGNSKGRENREAYASECSEAELEKGAPIAGRTNFF